METFTLVLSLLLCQQVSTLRTISAEEFARFPVLHHLDRYPPCVEELGGVYCVADAELVASSTNQLYDAITNYSLSAMRHMDYRKIRYGYCMTRRCREWYRGGAVPLEGALGACLNHSLEREHGLQARLLGFACYPHDNPITWLDRAAGCFFLVLAALAIAGTFDDWLTTKKDSNGLLLCFSVSANWANLTAPWPQNPNTARLIGINGLRTVTSIIVVLIHLLMPLPAAIENPYAFEETMESEGFQYLGNSHVIVQTFLFLSGMFLAYTSEVASERRPRTWRALPRAVLLRWLRLTPIYLTVILYSATWQKFIPQGPMWKELVDDESRDCRRDWLSMVFFYNNYVYGSNCNPHHWSSDVDMQLHVVGLVLLMLPAARRAAAIALLVAAGMVLPALETYYRDLDGTFIPYGRYTYSLADFNRNETFNYVHKRTHTNTTGFFLGMAFGLFLYKWMKTPVDTSKYKRYAWLYWTVVPLCFLLIYCNSFQLRNEGPRPSVYIRILYALFPKLFWSVFMSAIIFGLVCQVENVYQRVFEWRGWVPLAKLTYCTYNVHMIIIRWLYASDTQLVFVSGIHLMVKAVGIEVLTFGLATVAWLLVEAPGNNLVRVLFPEKKSIIEAKRIEKNE